MRFRHGAFSYLPDLTDEEIKAQIAYCLKNGWSVSVEYTDDPHPFNVYWEMFDLPMFDVTDPEEVMEKIRACRQQFPNHYIRVNAFDRFRGIIALNFLVHRPKEEPGFRLERIRSKAGLEQKYKIYPYALDKPKGSRY